MSVLEKVGVVRACSLEGAEFTRRIEIQSNRDIVPLLDR